MNSKILLLSIAVIAVGLFAMPSSLSLFAGQHTFDDGNAVQCTKCHQDIYDELNNGGKFGTSTAHDIQDNLKQCTGCHKTGSVLNIPADNSSGTTHTYAGPTITGAVGGPHAAVTMECAGCHTGVPAELINSNEAHGDYYNSSLSSGILKGANEACVGCHTHINVNATWRRSTGYNMTITESVTGSYSVTFLVNNTYNETKTDSSNVAGVVANGLPRVDGTY